MSRELTHERLLEVLHYDPQTGVFYWKDHADRRAGPGIAGCMHQDGYNRVRVDGRLYLASRLAWFYLHGAWPAENIDHRDGVENGDGINNLRPCTQQQNTWNARISKANKSGFKGVSWDERKSRWRAVISINGGQKYLGRFDSPSEAHAAYVKAAAELFGDFARTA